MRLIVGLGNPGAQYDRTPHNAGFEVVDILAQRHRARFATESRFQAQTADIVVGQRRVVLMKPMTYMNLSGQSVAAWARKNGAEPGEILVVSDDFHLPVGTVRLRASGSHGGQKGLLSIMECLGSLDYPRLRVGIKPLTGNMGDASSFVLRKMHPKDREALELALDDAADATEMLLERGLEKTMSAYNKKSPGPQ